MIFFINSYRIGARSAENFSEMKINLKIIFKNFKKF